MVLVAVSPQLEKKEKKNRVEMISHGTSFVYRGVTCAYDLRKASQCWQHARNSARIVLGGFSLLLIEMGLTHFLKQSIWALDLNPPLPPLTFTTLNFKIYLAGSSYFPITCSSWEDRILKL